MHRNAGGILRWRRLKLETCNCKAMHDMTWKSGVNDMNSELAKSNRNHGGRLCKSDRH
jgi:hypothetical protein